MNIYTIFTGGTIGSSIDNKGFISNDSGMQKKLIANYIQNYGNKINFIVREPYSILSENLAAKNLNTLIDTVNTSLGDNPDGIIVTHGTDTLQYTAAILGFVFSDVEIPIILVSSNYVLDDERANGFTNFRYAVDFIKGGYGGGVFVSYTNTKDLPYIHRGTRLQSPVQLSDNLTSVKNSWYGRFIDNLFQYNPIYKSYDNKEIRFREGRNIRLIDNTSSILRITPYPGMKYPALSDGIKAVLHESYHSGTICVECGLREFAADAAKRHIPVFLTGLDMTESEYETVGIYKKYGIIPLSESSVISQYCKLWLAISCKMNIYDVMMNSWGDDFI